MIKKLVERSHSWWGHTCCTVRKNFQESLWPGREEAMCCGMKTTSQILHITGWRANCRIHHRGSRSVWTTLTKSTIVIGDCLGSLSVAGIEHSDKKQLGEERVAFVLQSTLEGIWGKDSRQAPLGRNQSIDVKGSLLTCSTWLAQSGSYSTQDHLPIVVQLQVGHSIFPQQSLIIIKNASQICW